MEEAQVITLQREEITEDEIAGFHKHPDGEFWLIISSYAQAHGGPSQLEYHVKPGEPGYEETLALYRSMFRVTADEEDTDAVYFRARNYRALQALYEYLESGHYGFTFELGATRHNYIRVYRKQSKVFLTYRKEWMEDLINTFKTHEPEPEE